MAVRRKEKGNSAKLEGVFAKGYGVVPRAVMLRDELSPEARLLYAYFCVLSGNDGGFQPCPPEELILSTLQISHTRYLRHRKLLTDGGYLCFRQNRRSIGGGRQLYEGAEFLVVKHPDLAAKEALGEEKPHEAKAADASFENEVSLSALAALQEGVFSQGFGLVPRLPLFDRALSVEAKALYVFLCLYANAALREAREANVKASFLETRLMGRKRVQHAMKELIEAGYVRRAQRREGSFGSNVYILCFDPSCPAGEEKAEEAPVSLPEVQFDTADSPSSEVKNDTAENPEFSFACREVSSVDTSMDKPLKKAPRKASPQGRNATAKNATAKIEAAENDTATIEKNTEPENISYTNGQPVKNTAGGQTGAPVSMGVCIAMAESQLEAEILREVYDADLIDGIVLELARVYAMDEETQLRGDGRMLSALELKTVYRRLRFKHIEQVIESLRSADASALRNPQAYLRTCLYNAPFTLGLQDLLKLGSLS